MKFLNKGYLYKGKLWIRNKLTNRYSATPTNPSIESFVPTSTRTPCPCQNTATVLLARRNKFNSKTFLLFLLAAFFIIALNSRASTIDDLNSKINDKNSQINQLQKEIDQYEKDLQSIGEQSNTLQSAVKTLDVTRQKLLTDIKITENKISSTNLSIEQLGLQVGNKQESIDVDTQAVSSALRNISQTEDNNLLESLLTYGDMSELWNQVESMQQFQTSVRDNITELKNLKKDLEKQKTDTEKKRDELVALKSQLADQQKIVEANKKEKDTLLAQTKNKESNYKVILESKKTMRDAFEKELTQFESQLKFAIDPSKLPHTGSGVLTWPLDSVFVTQGFGDTDFAKDHTAVYNGKGHNGVDFRAAMGTPIKAALSGTISGTGDTDTVCPGASYGKWVLIKHNNGLSTLYAHFSYIKVVAGQSISTGDIIGYSGSTGYATGPHLHFSVFASQGVEITSLKSKSCKGTYTMPVASFNAYLNPLSYL